MQHINLLEPAQRPQPPSRGQRAAVLGLALFATLVFAVWVVERRAGEAARTELARVRAESDRLTREQASLAAPNAAALAALAAEEREIVSLEGVARLLTSGSLGRTRGFTGDLRAFGRATAPGIWFTTMRLDNAGDAMTLEGRALDSARVPALLRALEAEPHFAGTKFASVELQPAGEAVAGAPQALGFRIATPVASAPAASTGGAP